MSGAICVVCGDQTNNATMPSCQRPDCPHPPQTFTPMSAEPFGRQPQPVRLDGSGDLRDVDHYLNKIKSIIENSSYDTVTRMGNQIIIYPRAVND